MKFTYAAISATLVVCAAAATSSSPPVPVATQNPCLKKCADGPADKVVNCYADCLGNPHPSDDQANQTTKCVADCPMSDGSAEGNDEYATCVKGCVDQHYMPVNADQTSGETPSSVPSQTGGSQSPSESGTTTTKNDTKGNSTSSATSKPTNGSSASNLMVSISFAGTVAAIAVWCAL